MFKTLIETKLLLILSALVIEVISQCIQPKIPIVTQRFISQCDVDKFYRIASDIQQSLENIQNSLLECEVHDQTVMREHFASQHIPVKVMQEVKDSEKLQILKHILDFNNYRHPDEIFEYTHPTIKNCSKSVTRELEEFSQCDFSGRHKCIYEKSGLCFDKDRFGSGAAFTNYIDAVPSRSILDRDHSKCDLVSARGVSQALKLIFDRPYAKIQPNFLVPSFWCLIWAQFVMHDIMNTKFHGDDRGAHAVTGVFPDMTSKLPKSITSPYSADIPVSCEDSFYSSKKVVALPFVRAALVQDSCQIKSGRPISKSSPACDLDPVYESIKNGKVKFLKGTCGKLPIDSKGHLVIADPRSKTHATLLIVHKTFIRLHNLIVDALRSACPDLTCDELWERARQINIALYQKMTFNEIVPAMIGDKNAAAANLTSKYPMKSGVTPVIINEFATICGRQAHEFINDNCWIMDNNMRKLREIPLRDTFFNEDLAHDQEDALLLGAAAQPWKIDGMTNETGDHLFQTTQEYGTDLIATDIQRARDTGVVSYLQYSTERFGRCITGWNSFDWSDKAKILAQGLYSDINDVDMYFGVLAERHRTGPLPTSCIEMCQNQYSMIRNGDKKFYLRTMNSKQIRSINRINLSNLLCILTKTKMTLTDGRFGYTRDANRLVRCRCNSLESCGFDARAFCKKGACLR